MYEIIRTIFKYLYAEWKKKKKKLRKLKGKWTIDDAVDIHPLYGMDLEKKLTAALADEIKREANKEILKRLSQELLK